MKAFLWYALAAVLEIGGCYAVWLWLREGRNGWIFVPLALLSLVLFAATLTRVDVALAGRAYAAYGGVYVVASLLWLIAAESRIPDGWDVLGVGICLVGSAIIVLAPHGAR
ncbi:MAG TPA: YnfA family protein [Candidatus Acidoferrales bacterium]|nr:YnfA family protein [Candidatus Acidoferrales bacterium]